MIVRLTNRELATVLAALRYRQQALAANGDEGARSEHFDDVTPLSVEEIDHLCERLNGGSSPQEAMGDNTDSYLS